MKKAHERRLVMKNIFRTSALALSLVAGAALIAAPASVAEAKSIQRDGYFGGTWNAIGPKNNRYVKRHHRNYGYNRGYYNRGYYGPRYGYSRYRGYGYGPYAYGYDRGPGFSITIR
jgi:hypothetical protein